MKLTKHLFVLAASFLLTTVSLTAKQKPNVILIMIDDMGWADSSTYGSEYYQTPNMTRLAEQGMLFTDAYSASPLCSPTRASIMSGQHPARLRMTEAILPSSVEVPRALAAEKDDYLGQVESKNNMPLEVTTLAETLRDAGYHTAHIGKWHLAPSDENWNASDESFNAEHQGFDFVIGGGHLPGPTDYYSPYRDTNSGRVIPNLTPGPAGEYLNERLAQESINWISSVKDSEQPFYLNFWHYAVHGPIIPKKDLLPKYIELRDPEAGQRCPEYATMVESVDNSIGILLDWLDQPENSALKENTFVLLTSDNGAVIHNEIDGDPWSSNRPLRGGKANIYEGGTRVPWIVRWNDTLAGTICHTPVISTDIYPTILELVGIKADSSVVLDGRSIVPMLQGKNQEEKPIFVDFPHNKGLLNAASSFVRLGDWKLIRFYWAGAGAKEHYYELFNLKDDPMEAVNLAEYYPKKVHELDALVEGHLQDTDALVPLPNPRYSGKVVPPVRLPEGHSKIKSPSVRPQSLRLEHRILKPSESGSKTIQLIDEMGAQRKTAAILYQGQEWVEVENLPGGKVKVSWDVAKKNGSAQVLFGWSGGHTAPEVDDWTLGPYKLEIK